MRQLTIIFLILFTLPAINGMAQKYEALKLDEKGEFKIVQFTDTHINQEKEDISLVLNVIRKVVENEKPDLVVFTGDIVTEDNPKKAYSQIGDLLKETATKWVVVLGNHDDEHNTKRTKIVKILSKIRGCLNQVTDKKYGYSDFVLKVGEGEKTSLLYFLDSNAYSTLKPKVEGYGWFTAQQINWYKEKSNAFTKANNGTPLPALAFFHIPLPEYKQVWNSETSVKIGVKNEKVCSPDINSGMFAAMVESGDMMGTFVGHDHVNDYIGVLYDIALAYGRCSSVGTTYGDLPSGGRVIVLKEGKRQFDTWIREANGSILYKCSYPTSFITETEAN
ncbi:MAG: metallophosphoesterase family protein [Bacteroidota bacterium]